MNEVRRSKRELVDHEVVELAALLQAGYVSSVEVTQAYFKRIKALNGPFETYADNGLYNAFVRIDEEGALAEARNADKRLHSARRHGPRAPWLCGIPMGFKDSIGTKGFKQQNGTTAFAGNVALLDSTPVARLREQGVVALGITVCSAFSGSIAGTFSGNAWNLDYVPGGSSQGSGVAPIARLAAACLGEETGGSIIFPAACNGASSIKPSLGLGSTAGVMPLSPSYDVIGPICRSGRDAALIMNAILGPDPDGDPQTTFAPVPFPEIPMVARSGSKPLKGLTIGIHKKDWVTTSPGGTRQNVDPQSLYEPSHQAALSRFIGELKQMGAKVKDFDGADFLVFSEEENPYYNNPAVLQVVDGSNITPSAAVINPNRYDIRYVDAVADFAATRPPDQQATLLAQYGRQARRREHRRPHVRRRHRDPRGHLGERAGGGGAAQAPVGGELQAPVRRGGRRLHARAHARRQAGPAVQPELPRAPEQPARELDELPDGVVPDRLRRRPADQRRVQGPALLRAGDDPGDGRLPGALPAVPPGAPGRPAAALGAAAVEQPPVRVRRRRSDAVERPARPRGACGMSILTIGWERAENAADLPRDSGLVFPQPILTIAWRPMLNSAVLDWDEPDAAEL